MYLFDIGLSLSAMVGLSLCVPAALAIVLGGEWEKDEGGGHPRLKGSKGRSSLLASYMFGNPPRGTALRRR